MKPTDPVQPVFSRRAIVAVAARALGASAFAPWDALAQPFVRGPGQPWSGDVVFVDQRVILVPNPDQRIPLHMGQGRSPWKRVSLPTQRRRLAPLIQQRWLERREMARLQALDSLNERDIGSGFRTSRNRLVLGTDMVDWSVAVDGRGFTLRSRIPGNVLDTRLRTPGPLPSGTDPAFEIRFDVFVEMPVELRDGRRFEAMPPVLNSVLQRPDSHNLLADVALALDALITFLGGSGFITAAFTSAGRISLPFAAPISGEIDSINAALRTLRPNDFVRPVRDASRGDLIIEARAAGSQPIVR